MFSWSFERDNWHEMIKKSKLKQYLSKKHAQKDQLRNHSNLWKLFTVKNKYIFLNNNFELGFKIFIESSIVFMTQFEDYILLTKT